MKAISRRVHKLEIRRIEVTVAANESRGAKDRLLAKLNAIRARLDAARDGGEDATPIDTEAVMALWRARIAEYRKAI